jgi:archaemetzincin
MLAASLLLSFAAAAPALDVPERPVIIVVPLGTVSPDIVRMVHDTLAARFRFEVRVAEPLAMPEDAWYAPRKRWRAEKILAALDRRDWGPAWRVAAITEAPISTTKGSVDDWGIAGLGSIDGLSSVFSGYIFRGIKKRDPAEYRRFIDNLVLHEVGHTLGLLHCPLDRCIMADAHGDAIKSARASINEFCPRCYARIKQHLKATEPRGRWTADELRLWGGEREERARNGVAPAAVSR